MTSDGNSPLPRYPFARGPYGSSTLAYDVLRSSGPICRVALPSGWEAWLVTRYSDICTVHRDPTFSRAEAVQAGAALVKDASMELLPCVLQNTDGEQHSHLRGVFANHYGAVNAPRWADVIEREAHHVIDNLSEDILDLRGDVFEPIARRSADKIFGFPFHQGILELFFDGRLMVELRQRLASALRREDLPDGSFLDKLRTANRDGHVSEMELLANLMVFATVTFEAIGGPFLGGLFAMLRNHDQWETCLRERSLVSNAVQEMLRCYPNGDGQFLRIATAHAALSGVTIRRGEAILAPVAAANVDPEVFPNPRHFDVRRPNSNKHIAFGFGTHHCLGSHLVETWMRSVLTVLLDRLPSLRLAVDPARIAYRPHPLITTMERLPVRYRSGAVPTNPRLR